MTPPSLPRLKSATLVTLFDEDGTMHMTGSMVMLVNGAECEIVCNPEDVMRLYTAAADALVPPAPEAPVYAEQYEEVEDLVLGEEAPVSNDHAEARPPLGVVVPLAERRDLKRRGAQAPRRLDTDDQGNPRLSTGGVDVDALLRAENPGENGVDLL